MGKIPLAVFTVILIVIVIAQAFRIWHLESTCTVKVIYIKESKHGAFQHQTVPRGK